MNRLPEDQRRDRHPLIYNLNQSALRIADAIADYNTLLRKARERTGLDLKDVEVPELPHRDIRVDNRVDEAKM